MLYPKLLTIEEEEVLPAVQTNEELKLDETTIESIGDVAVPSVKTAPPDTTIDPIAIESGGKSSDSSRVNPKLMHSKTMPILSKVSMVQKVELQSRSSTPTLSKPVPTKFLCTFLLCCVWKTS